MDDIPGEKMFGQFPEQAGKKGRLKGGCEVDPLIRDDFVNQKKHAIGEEKREQVFQDPLNRRSYRHGNPSLVTLQEGDNGAKNHAHQEEDSRQENHQKINGYSPQHSPAFLYPEHDIESDPQGAEDPGGEPEQTYKSQDSHNLTALDDVHEVSHYLWIQCRSHISEIGANMIEHFLVVVEISSNQVPIAA